MCTCQLCSKEVQTLVKTPVDVIFAHKIQEVKLDSCPLCALIIEHNPDALNALRRAMKKGLHADMEYCKDAPSAEELSKMFSFSA